MKYIKAAGVIPVTHASGGPLNDIVVPFNGAPTGPPHSSVSLSIAMLLSINFHQGIMPQRRIRSQLRCIQPSPSLLQRNWHSDNGRERGLCRSFQKTNLKRGGTLLGGEHGFLNEPHPATGLVVKQLQLIMITRWLFISLSDGWWNRLLKCFSSFLWLSLVTR